MFKEEIVAQYGRSTVFPFIIVRRQVGRSKTTNNLDIIQWSLYYIHKGLGKHWMVLSRKLSFIIGRLLWKSIMYWLEVDKDFGKKTTSEQSSIICEARKRDIL